MVQADCVCGRYASTKSPDALVAAFDLEVDATEGDAPGPDYNIAPTKNVMAVLSRRPKGSDAADRAVRQLRVLRWGLVPSWAKDPSVGARLINARAETAAEKPSFARAMASRRCLIPADGFYEWYLPDRDKAGADLVVTATGKPVKQPFFLRPADGSILPMAGLYEFWRDRTRDDGDPAAWWVTCTVLTTEAEEGGRIHDRMPMAVHRDQWAKWLDPDRADAADLMVPASRWSLEVYPVSREVSNARNNGPSLMARIPYDEVLPGVDWPLSAG